MKKYRRDSRVLAVLLCFLIVTMVVAWSSTSEADQNVNVPICTATNNQDYPQIVSDGSGGAIIAWNDYRMGSSWDIYAQRVNASGAVQWAANGVVISNADGDQGGPQLISDGSGGAFIVWHDTRDDGYGDLYAQRVNASGAAQWTANGVVVCNATRRQSSIQLISDGVGGVIITWEDARTSGDLNIYAQRLNGSGVSQWTANGLVVCNAAKGQQDPQLISDGSGGAIITWADARTSFRGIYAQRLNASGAVQWTSNGVAVCITSRNHQHPQLTSDGSGGTIITWYDDRNTTDYNIYAQKLNASGAVQWTANGVVVCNAASGQEYPQLINDGSGGAIITWLDFRNSDVNIYAQMLNASGAAQWTANGVVVCNATDDQRDPQLISDGSGGAIITWHDYRSNNYDIYAQRLNASGVAQWTANGAVISNATDDQEEPQLISDGSNGAIITWYDGRNGSDDDIYAQRVFSDGSLPDSCLFFPIKTKSGKSAIIYLE